MQAKFYLEANVHENKGANIPQIFDGNSIKANQILEWKEIQPWFWYLQIQHLSEKGNAQHTEI